MTLGGVNFHSNFHIVTFAFHFLLLWVQFLAVGGKCTPFLIFCMDEGLQVGVLPHLPRRPMGTLGGEVRPGEGGFAWAHFSQPSIKKKKKTEKIINTHLG